MFTKFIDAAKRYLGYTRFVAPYWALYTEWLAAHPQTTGAILIALLVFGLR